MFFCLQTFSSGIFFKQLTATEQERAGPSHSVGTLAFGGDGAEEDGIGGGRRATGRPQALLLIQPRRKIHARCIWPETYILVFTSFTSAQPSFPTSASASSTGSEKQHQDEISRMQAVEQALRIPSFGVGHFSSLNTAIVLTDEQPAHNSMI